MNLGRDESVPSRRESVCRGPVVGGNVTVPRNSKGEHYSAESLGS